MSDIIKKGWLDVKKKRKVGSAYKRKFVILRNNSALKCKTVDILDTETVDENADIIPLGEVWTVQDKSSKTKGRYPFELIMEEEVQLTFSCSSIEEREQWVKAFDALNQLTSDGQQSASSITEFFPVTLVKNRSAQEIGHSGQYLLSIRDNDIILHWRTGAIAHHWPRKSIVKLFINSDREGYLTLHACKIGSSRPQQEFEFMTDSKIAYQILKLWNICLLEAIPCSPEKLNEISSFLNTGSKNDKSRTPVKKPLSLSFRTRKSASVKQKTDADSLRRADSMPRSRTVIGKSSPRMLDAPPVAARSRKSLTKSWSGSSCKPFEDSGVALLSQNALAPSPSIFRGSASPPPLPPRPHESSSDEDDPDYAYIDEKKVKGPENHSHSANKKKEDERVRSPSPSIDEQLKEIERSIKREKKAKKRAAADAEKRRAHTIHRSRFFNHRQINPLTLNLSLGPNLTFVSPDPEDYLDPMPAQRARSQLSSSSSAGCYEVPVITHSRSSSEPDPTNVSFLVTSLSQPAPETSSYHGGIRLLSSSVSPSQDKPSPNISPTLILDENRPALPPRTWRRTSSASANSITSSCSVGEGSVVSKSSSVPAEEIDLHSPTAGQVRGRSASTTDDTHSKLRNSVIPEEPQDSGCSTPAMEESTDTLQVFATSPSATDHYSPPPLPPRSPLKERLSRQSSSSSVSSTSSSRCPRCRSKRSKSSVGKTVSLNDHKRRSSPHTEDGPKGSLPDLNKTLSVPEDSLSNRQQPKHSQECRESLTFSTDGIPSGSTPSLPANQYLELIDDSSAPTDEHSYLQLLADKNGSPGSPLPSEPENELQSQLERLDSYVQALENLEHKVSRQPKSSNEGISSSRPGQAQSRDEQKRVIRTDLDAAIKQAKQVQMDLSRPAKRVSSESESSSSVVVNGHTPCRRISGTRGPPALQKHPTVSGFPLHSNSNNNATTYTTHMQHHTNGSLPQQNGSLPQSSPPPIPPRSFVSLEQPNSPKLAVTKFHSPGKQTNRGFNSLPRTKGVPPLQRRFNREDHESSTVFIHHLKRSITKI